MTYNLVITVPLKYPTRSVLATVNGEYGDLEIAHERAKEIAEQSGLRCEVFQCTKLVMKFVKAYGPSTFAEIHGEHT